MEGLWLDSRLVKANNYDIVNCCFSTKQSALMSKNNDWLALCQYDMSKRNNMLVCELLIQSARTIQTSWSSTSSLSQKRKLVLVICNKAIAHLTLNDNHSLSHPITPNSSINWKHKVCFNIYQILYFSPLQNLKSIYNVNNVVGKTHPHQS